MRRRVGFLTRCDGGRKSWKGSRAPADQRRWRGGPLAGDGGADRAGGVRARTGGFLGVAVWQLVQDPLYLKIVYGVKLYSTIIKMWGFLNVQNFILELLLLICPKAKGEVIFRIPCAESIKSPFATAVFVINESLAGVVRSFLSLVVHVGSSPVLFKRHPRSFPSSSLFLSLASSSFSYLCAVLPPFSPRPLFSRPGSMGIGCSRCFHGARRPFRPRPSSSLSSRCLC